MMQWWIAWPVAALALVGLWVTVDKTAAGLLRAWMWLRYDRVAPLLEDEPGWQCWKCGAPVEFDRASGLCDACGLEELPPERSWEEMTADQPIIVTDMTLWRQPQVWHGPERERRATWWEAEHRAAYESLGFDYPSGLVARVRELTP